MSLPLDAVYRLGSDGPGFDKLIAMIRSAHATPSVAAVAPWAFVVVRRPFPDKLVRKPKEILSPFELDASELISGAAWLVAVLGEKAFPMWEESVFAASVALYSAAREHGWGSVLFQPLESDAAVPALNAPSWYRLGSVVAVGSPEEQVASFHSKPLRSVIIVHENGENRILGDDEIPPPGPQA